MLNIEKLKDLDKMFPQIYGNNIFLDGITNIIEYKKTSNKILWVLKEPDDKNQLSLDLREIHNKDISVAYKKWRMTYKLIIKVSYAIINRLYDYNNIPKEYEIRNILKNIAIINIKKIGGYSRSSTKIIRDMYKKHKDVILQQIKYIDPNIIINGSTVNKLMDDLQISGIKQINKFKAANFDNGIIINAYHPNCRYEHKKYFNNIIEYINKNE